MKRGRLQWYHPDELSGEQRGVYEQIVGSRGPMPRPTPLTDAEGRLEGPFNAMLSSPEVGAALQAVGAALRSGGALPREKFETIVLIVGAERRADYEWYAHAPLAERAGVSAEAIAAIRAGDYARALDADLLALVRAGLDHEQPPAGVVAAVAQRYGDAAVTEVVATVGYYDLLGALLRTWDTPLPDGAEPPYARLCRILTGSGGRGSLEAAVRALRGRNRDEPRSDA